MKQQLEIAITNAVMDHFDAAELRRQQDCDPYPVPDTEGYVSLGELFAAKHWGLFFTMSDALTIIDSLIEMGHLVAHPTNSTVSDDEKRFRLAQDADEQLLYRLPTTAVLQ